MRGHKTRIQPDRFTEAVDSLLRPAHRPEHGSQIAVNLRVARLSRDCEFVLLARFVIPFQLRRMVPRL
jgi:hypothetical protein